VRLRECPTTTTAGDVTVKIPRTRTGSFFPALLEPRRRIDVALHAVVMQAYVEGVSTRRVDDLVVAMGGTGISKSEVSRICAQLGTDVAAWRSWPLDELASPYVFLDATYCKTRDSYPQKSSLWRLLGIPCCAVPAWDRPPLQYRAATPWA
jgi:putative transposase